MAWTSSMITDSTPARMLRVAEVSIRNSDSGVVIRTSGGRLAMTRRSWAGVSPVRSATLMCGAGSPSSSHCVAIPDSGARRLRSTSTARAFSGLMYSTRTPGSSRGVRQRSIAHRKAARVLPDPVGATASTSAPAMDPRPGCRLDVRGSREGRVEPPPRGLGERGQGIHADHLGPCVRHRLPRCPQFPRTPAGMAPFGCAADGLLGADGPDLRARLRPIMGHATSTWPPSAGAPSSRPSPRARTPATCGGPSVPTRRFPAT